MLPQRLRALAYDALFSLFLEATNGEAVCAAVVAVRRADIAIAIEVEVVRAVVIGRTRPPKAVVTDTVEAAIAVVQTTRSRIPNRAGAGAAELAGEVHTFVRGVPSIGEPTAGICGFGPYAAVTAGRDFPAGRAGIVNRLGGLPSGVVR